MNLFENITGQPENILPQDGIVHYHGTIMPAAKQIHHRAPHQPDLPHD